jgi:hypothetical protein
VRAIDLNTITGSSTDTSNWRLSPYAQVVTLQTAQPQRPTITTLLLTVSSPTFQWSHPDIASVRFFRIYRDDQRYDLTSTNTTTWTDPNPGGAIHKYEVTAVGPGLNESQKSNAIVSVNL